MTEPIGDLQEAERVIRAALEVMRPFLHQDGGDIEFVSVDTAGIVELRFLGACATCSLSIMTLRAGIERGLMLACPAIQRIEAVSA
jgi:Fe-S cluster biogenesis protein NfuA